MIEISPTSEHELPRLEQLATEIWHEHYTKIIGKEQVLYMLDKFQSIDAMKQQISDGFEYFSILDDTILVGYIAVQVQTDCLFLSKLYLITTKRGQGIARIALKYIESHAFKQSQNRIRLTVNKQNLHSVCVYEKLGFCKIKEAVFDIGNGYVMDDYVMEKPLKPQNKRSNTNN